MSHFWEAFKWVLVLSLFVCFIYFAPLSFGEFSPLTLKVITDMDVLNVILFTVFWLRGSSSLLLSTSFAFSLLWFENFFSCTLRFYSNCLLCICFKFLALLLP